MHRRLLGNNALLCAIAAVLLLLGVATSWQCKNFQWLSRFGALVICTGVLALARPSIVGKALLVEVSLEGGGKSNDPQSYLSAGQAVPQAVLEDRKSQFAVGVVGPILCLIGTAINGFADLLNKPFGW